MKKLLEALDQIDYSGVVTLRQGPHIIFEQAKGYRDRANQVKNNLNTKFGIASGTKLFTAIGILKLIEEGLCSLDDKVFNIVDKPFPQYDDDVTLQDLLSHMSGLPDYYDEDFITDFDNFKVSVPWSELKKPSDYMAVMPDRPMKYPRQTKFHYNNGGYVLLAMVIEALKGDYHKFIHAILSEADLHDTGFYFFDRLPENCANGYIELKDGYKTNIYSLPIIGGGDGGIFTTSHDLLKVWDALTTGQIISRALVDMMFCSYNRDDPYGLGVWLTEKACPVITGVDAGVSFVSGYRWDHDLVYNILCNNGNDAWQVSKIIKDHLKKK